MAPRSSRPSVYTTPIHRRPPKKSSRLRFEELESRTNPALFNVHSPYSFTGLNNNGCVATGDLNNDGLEDAILTNFGTDYGAGAASTITILYGKSGGGFNKISLATGGKNVAFVTIADINGDGWLDAVAVEANQQNTGTFTVYKNDGAGNLVQQGNPHSTFGNNSSWVGLADITGDGVLDVVVCSFGKDDGTGENITGNNVTIFQGNADGQGHGDFTYSANPTTTLAPEIQFIPTALAIADFDGDGHLDIAACVPGVPADTGQPQPDGSVYIFAGTGSGGFAAPSQYDTGGALPVNMQTGDLNGDGKSDLVIANAGDPNASPEFSNNSVGVILNVSSSGNVLFGLTNSLTANCYGTFAVQIADFDLDGKPDIASVNYGGQLGSPAAFVSAYKGDGAGSFNPFAPGTFDTQTNFGGGQYLAVGDFDANGTPDLIVSHATNLVGLMFNTSVAPGPTVTINQATGQVDPTNGVSIKFDVNFSAAVTGFGDSASDVDLSGSTGGGAGLTATVTPVNATKYTVTVTGMTGTGTVKATIPAGAATASSGGLPNQPSTSSDNQVSYDYVAPTVTINQAAGQSDPTTLSPIKFTVVFSENVSGFSASDVDLSASSLTGLSATVTQNSASNYTVNVTGMSGTGTVIATIPAGAATDGAGNLSTASSSTDNSVTFGNPTTPTVTINQAAGQADPTNLSPISYTVHFSQAVTGFDSTDVLFNGSTVGGTLVASVIGGSPGQDYTVLVTGMSGQGTVVASIPANAAVNNLSIGNSASTSTDNTVTFDNIAPGVTIDQAVGQPDPTNIPTVKFAVKFTEPVTGFDATDVSLAGTNAGGTLSVSVTGSLDTYTVTVTGMTTRGSVIASIPAGGANDAAGNGNLQSTSSDNSVYFLNTGTIGFTQAVFNTTEDLTAHTVTVTVTRAGQTEGAVSIDYATSDGTAHSGGQVLRGLNDYTPTNGTLSWADGEGGDKTFTVQILPDNFNEGKELINLNLTNPVGSPGLGQISSAVAIAPSDPFVISPTARKRVINDDDSDRATITFGGSVGTASIYLTDPDGDGRGPIEWVELNGTLPDPLRPRTSLSVAVTKNKLTGDGVVNIGEITGSGLRSITARRSNLNLDGINLNGYLGSLNIGNIMNGADITTLASTDPRAKTRITAGTISDGTAINVGGPVSTFSALSFGIGSLTAPIVGTISIRYDMGADVSISGVGVAPGKKALGLLRVRGNVVGSDIMVNGDVGTVVVGSFRGSRLFAGYTGPDDPTLTGASFNLPSTIGAFRATSKIDAFDSSYVIATTVKSASLRSINANNGGTAFGFFADNMVGRLSIGSPMVFSYRPIDGFLKVYTDFVVEIV